MTTDQLEYLTAQKQAYDKLRADIRDALNGEGKHFNEIAKNSRILHTYDEISCEAIKRIMGAPMSERRTRSVGAYIMVKMAERDWSVEDLAQALRLPVNEAEDLITGRKRVLARHAEGLSRAFGTSAHVWLNLQKANDHA